MLKFYLLTGSLNPPEDLIPIPRSEIIVTIIRFFSAHSPTVHFHSRGTGGRTRNESRMGALSTLVAPQWSPCRH